MSHPVVALQLYTLRNSMNCPAGVADTLKRVRKIGYEAVELAGYGGCTPKQIREITDGEGLAICSAHAGFEAMRDDPQQTIEDHLTLGCRYIVSGSPAEYHSGEGFVRFAKEISEVAAKLAAGGLTYSYHHHSFELERFGDRTGLAILCEDSDSRVVNIQLDLYWVQHGGGEPTAWIKKLAARAPTLHLKDMAMRGREQLYAEVGEGNLNWPGIFDAAKQAGVAWYIVEQDECQRDPFESVAISLRNLKAMGGLH